MSGIPLDVAGFGRAEAALADALTAARSSWRRRIVFEGVVRAAIVAAVILLAMVLVAVVFTPPTETLGTMRTVGWVGMIVSAAWWIGRPMVRTARPSALARYLEESHPEFQASVETAVDGSRIAPAERNSPALAQRLIERATGMLVASAHGTSIEAPRTRRALFQLLTLVVGVTVLVVLGPRDWRATLQAMASPWTPIEQFVPAHRLLVEPGNVTVPRGSAIDITVRANGFVPGDALLLTREEGATAWDAQPMLEDSAGVFSIRLFDLRESLTYRIEAGDAATTEMRITVTDLPAVQRLGSFLEYPSYTGLAPDSFPDQGDVAAVTGTRVTLQPQLTMPVGRATVRFDDGRELAMTLGDSLNPTVTFPVDHSGSYTIDLEAPDGTTVPGRVRWVVTALEDRAPVVRIMEPGRDTKPSNIEEVQVAAQADDDYGVRSLELRYSVNGGAEQVIPLASGLAPGSLTPRAVHTLFLEELSLQAGDLVAYYAAATDGAGNTAKSDIYFLEIRPFSRNYRQADQGDGGGGGGGGGGEAPADASRIQREIIVASFNLLRDSADADPAKFKEDLATVAVQQEKARDEARTLATQLVERQAAAVDSTFLDIAKALDSAGVVMEAASASLRASRPTEAVPHQQRSLQQLQRAEALYRDIELQLNQQGGGGGGGGGGGTAPEDLADLFELDTDKMRNQYEAVQRSGAAESEAAAAVDSSRERLRELARRLEQENARAERARDAMQQRMGAANAGAANAGAASGASGGTPGASGAAGGGSSAAAQRRLADEAEAEARRLERLSRDQANPELAAAAAEARQAADAMRRAAAGTSGEASSALESLREAGRRVGAGQESSARDQAQRLADRAAQLKTAQERLTEDAAGLSGQTGTARERASAKLEQEASQIAGAVRQLTDDVRQAARATQGADPGAARAMTEAANGLTEMQVAERIEYQPRLAGDTRIDSASANRFSREIGTAIGTASDRLRQAAGSVGSAPGRQQERALERARELVRDMQSLQDRMGGDSRSGASQGQGQAGQQGQGRQGEGQGQQGQGQGQGQGEQGQGQQGQGQAQGGQATGGRPGQGGDGDARQLSREVGRRSGAAEALRDQLREQGIGVPELDDAIATMRRLSRDGVIGDPVGRQTLLQDALKKLQQAEFQLWQRFDGANGSRPAIGDLSRVPPRYRQMVEEYYRAIGQGVR